MHPYIAQVVAEEPDRKKRLAMLRELRAALVDAEVQTVLEEINEQGGAGTRGANPAAAKQLGITLGALESLLKRHNNRRLHRPRNITRSQ